MAAGAEVLAIKFLDRRGRTEPLKEALTYVINNIKPGDVWNYSPGSNKDIAALDKKEQKVFGEIEILLKKLEKKAPGTIAAGNLSFSLDDVHFPETHFSDNHDQIYVVGGINENEEVRGAFGEVVDFYAPGYNLPVLTNKGVLDNNSRGGTSLAAPHIAGLLFIGHYDESYLIKEQLSFEDKKKDLFRFY